MVRHLADLLAHDHPLFTFNLAQLEKASGNSGIDVRLIADTTERAHSLMRQLSIDPADTSAEELYHALNSAVRTTDAQLFRDTSFVLVGFDEGPVSLNLLDVIENSHHNLPFAERKVDHAQRYLRAEIIKRYAEHDRTSGDMVRQLAEQAGLIHGNEAEYEHVDGHLIGYAITKNEGEIDMERPKVLAVGDIITNAFIKMNEDFAEVTTDEKGYKRLSIELGAKLPYESVEIVPAVECSPNAAVSMSRLGLDVDLMSWLGDDDTAQQAIDYLKGENVGTDYMVVEEGMRSNYHYVLRYGADRTKLQRFEDYSYAWQDPVQVPDWLYLGVLGEKTWPLHEAMLDYLERNPSVKLVFQPGMYHLMWGAEKLAEFYKKAEIVIMNREEAAQVTGVDRGEVSSLMKALHDMGVSIAVVTDGADGAYASDGTKMLFMPNYPDPDAPLDRTGAGDAFASTIAAALALGESLETALRWAPINSAYVVQKLGAQAGLLQLDDIKRHLEEAPADYVVKEL